MTSHTSVQFMLVMVVVLTLTQGLKFAADAIDDLRRASRKGRLTCIAILRLLALAFLSAMCLWSSVYTAKALVVADTTLLGGGM